MTAARRLRRAGLLGLVGSLLLVASADAAWQVTGALTTQATAVSLNRPTAPTVANGTGADAGSVRVSWAASTLSNGDAVGGYRVERVVGATTTTTCTTTTALTCLDTAPVTQSASYRVVARQGTAWESQASPATPFLYDVTAPTTAAAISPVANGAGWSRTSVTVSLTASDAGSGVDRIVYSVDGGTAVTVAGATASFGLAAVSPAKTYTVRFRAYDASGNAEAEQTLPVRIDPDAPVSSATLSPAPNAAGWTRAATTVSVTATDTGGSGVKQVTLDGVTTSGASASKTITAEGVTTVAYGATDVADNTDSKQVVVRIDRVAPTATASQPADGARANLFSSIDCATTDGAVCLTGVSDATSGIASVGFTLTRGGTECLSGNAFVAGTACAAQATTQSGSTYRSSTTALTDAVMTTGSYVLTWTVTDVAGNTTTVTSSFAIVVPTLTAISNDSDVAGDLITNAQSQVLSGADADPGATVTVLQGASTICSGTAGSNRAWSCSAAGNLVAGSNAYVAQVSAGGVTRTSAPLTVVYDAIAPTTTFSPAGGFVVSSVTVTGSDAVAGVKSISYTVRTCTTSACTAGAVSGATTVAGNGATSVSTTVSLTGSQGDYRQISVTTTDRAGNASTTSSIFQVDATAPTIGSPVAPANNGCNQSNNGSMICVAVADTNGSGVASVTFKLTKAASPGCFVSGGTFSTATGAACAAIPMTLNGGQWRGALGGSLPTGSYTLVITATDNVGNVSTATSTFTI